MSNVRRLSQSTYITLPAAQPARTGIRQLSCLHQTLCGLDQLRSDPHVASTKSRPAGRGFGISVASDKPISLRRLTFAAAYVFSYAAPAMQSAFTERPPDVGRS